MNSWSCGPSQRETRRRGDSPDHPGCVWKRPFLNGRVPQALGQASVESEVWNHPFQLPSCQVLVPGPALLLLDPVTFVTVIS